MLMIRIAGGNDSDNKHIATVIVILTIIILMIMIRITVNHICIIQLRVTEPQ